MKGKFIYIKLFIVIIVALVIFSKIFVSKVQERTYFDSTEGVISKTSIFVGSGGYGNINNFSVKVGDKVNRGDILFTYIRSDIDGKVSNLKTLPTNAQVSLDYFNESFQFIVKSQISGTVKNIFTSAGGYVTKDANVIEIELAESNASAKFRISPELINYMSVGSKAEIKLPSSKVLTANVTSVNSYDNKTSTLDVNLNVSGATDDLVEGTPIIVRVFIEDRFAISVLNIVNKIPVGFIKSFLL